MKKEFSFYLFLVMGVFVFLIGACRNQEPILIGFSAGLTGRNADVGVDGRDGALLAIESINKSGGINGRMLELVVRDDLATAEGALAADLELKEEGVTAIIGHMTSETMMGAWPSTKDLGILYLSPTVSTPLLEGLDDNFYRLIVVNSYPAGQLAQYASNSLGIQSVVAIYDTDNFAFTKTYADGFKSQFQNTGGSVAAVYEFSSSEEPDFRPILEDAKKLDPDGILIVASAVDTAIILQQASLMEMNVQVLTSNWAFTEDFLKHGGRAIEGSLSVVSHDENNQSPQYLDFVSRFKDRYGRHPTFAAGYGYEAVTVLAAGLKKTNGNTTGLGDALLEIRDFPGVHGEIQFDPHGDVRRTLYLIAVQNGEFKTLQAIGIPSP